MKKFLPVILLLLLPPYTFGTQFEGAKADYDSLNYVSALRKFQDLAEANDNAEPLFYVALTQLKMSECRNALSSIKALLKKYPQHIDGHYLEGIINMSMVGEVSIFKKLGYAKSALKSWQSIVEIEPDNIYGNYAVFSYYANAPGIAGGNLDRARELQAHLQAISPVYGELGLAILKHKNEKFAEAERHYLKATQLDPGRASLYFVLAQFHLQRQEPEKVLTALQRYQGLAKTWFDPDNAVVLYMSGLAYANLDNVEDAEASFQDALLAYPSKRLKKMVDDALEDL
jgi:tetratricopeptide (TPR) repeat protein